LQNKSWSENTAETLSLVNGFVDIDGDSLTYNFTNIPNIEISINNITGTSTLNPSSDFNGARDVIFFAFDGTNLTESNNVTLTVNDVPAPQSSSGGSGGGSSSGGGGGGGKYICELDWQCGSWSECGNGKQERECALVQVPVFLLDKKCPQFIVPEQSRSCKVIEKETCEDGIKNQNEEEQDCGGVCSPCPISKSRPEQPPENNQNLITGAAIANEGKLSINTAWLMAAFILLIILALAYFKFWHKKILK